jgi:hypothetical protein
VKCWRNDKKILTITALAQSNKLIMPVITPRGL